MVKPVDWDNMLDHIAAARGLDKPNPSQVAEIQKALGPYPPEAVRQSVNEWLRTDTKAFNRMPFPGELLPMTQAYAREIAKARRALRELVADIACRRCMDNGFIEEETTNVVVPCEDCRPETFARWKGRHYDSKHKVDGCSECQAIIRGEKDRHQRGAA